MRAPPLLSRSSNKAAALIIVLAFVVLVTGLALAYLTRTTTDRQLAQSSYNDTSADLLARSALDIVVGDFKQEIVNGSNATSVSGTTIYIPAQTPYVVPQRNNPTPIPNLIRISVNGDPGITAPGVGSRASSVNSTNDPSANGRSISTTRWNKHCLIPVGNPSIATIENPSPTPSFTPPDWVIVTRAGPTPFASWDSTLADPTSNNYAIGRYAYAVYDEGGLLDMNTVGYPAPPATPIPELVQDIGRKGVPAWTDLTAIVPTPTPTPYFSGAYLMVPWINKLVGFRNYATTQQQSNVLNLDFPGSNGAPILNTSVASFMNYLMGGFYDASGGFSGQRTVPAIGFGPAGRDYGAVNPAADPNDPNRTDQAFVTRAELIRFFSTTNILSPAASVGVLQYMGTFSREQNKPTLPLTTVWPFTRVVLPQRFYLGNLNLVAYPSPTPTPIVNPTPTVTAIPTATPTSTLDPIRNNFGLSFVSVNTPPPGTPTPTPTWGPCDSQVRWKYVGQSGDTPLTFIPAFDPSSPALDFFQYINYALFGRTDNDSDDIPFTLGIGAALIDQYDVDGNPSSNANGLITGIYYGSGPSLCDLPTACLVYGVEYSISGSPSSLKPWYVLPSCMPPGPVPTPDSSPTLGSGPPLINSPTRNVGEFGWAYSILNAYYSRNNTGTGAPHLQYLIDFKDAYTPNSAPNPPPPDPNHNPDPALLDFFTYNSAPVRSGIVSLNTRQPPVLAAILKGAIYQGPGGQVLSQTQAMNAANNIVTTTTGQPAQSRADIARLASVVNTAVFPFNAASATQDTKDSIARVFSETTQTRTWGLLIDIVAQTGHYAPNAGSGPNTTNPLANFVVEGEKRYWLHIAIDRFDGSIVGQQLEEVTE